ncbi:MAG: RNA polymerase sigma factor FliA [Deltaproteobacteria bacterium]|nr:RNA polymerase sigma factor FliA [Deltaproteobacteria bacterium]
MKAYARQAATSERDTLILRHVDMARRIACRMARRLPPSITVDEVVAAAMLGLAEAADRYDSSRGEPFEAFAAPRVQGAVLDELRRGDPLPRRRRVLARKIGNTVNQLEGRLGRAAEDHEVAAELGVSVEEYRDDLEGLTHVALVELDERTVTGAVDPDVAHGRQHLSSPFMITERAQLKQELVRGLKSLPEREALVMALYYDEELTFAEIAQVLGVTESRICQIHSKAILRLRALLGQDNGDEDEPLADKPRSGARSRPTRVTAGPKETK